MWQPAFSVLHQVVTRHVHWKSTCSSDWEHLGEVTVWGFQNGRNFQKLPTNERSRHLSLDFWEERRQWQGTQRVVGGQVCVSLWFTPGRLSTVQVCTCVHIRHCAQEKELYKCHTGNIPTECWLYTSEAYSQVRRKSDDPLKCKKTHRKLFHCINTYCDNSLMTITIGLLYKCIFIFHDIYWLSGFSYLIYLYKRIYDVFSCDAVLNVYIFQLLHTM